MIPSVRSLTKVFIDFFSGCLTHLSAVKKTIASRERGWNRVPKGQHNSKCSTPRRRRWRGISLWSSDRPIPRDSLLDIFLLYSYLKNQKHRKVGFFFLPRPHWSEPLAQKHPRKTAGYYFREWMGIKDVWRGSAVEACWIDGFFGLYFGLCWLAGFGDGENWLIGVMRVRSTLRRGNGLVLCFIYNRDLFRRCCILIYS